MNRTPIEWTDFSANPLKYRTAAGEVVWACAKVSAGCTHCYSEALAHRYLRGGPFNAGVMAGLTPFLDERELRQMLTYKPATGKRCFVGDMTDVFGEWVPDQLLSELFFVMRMRRDVTWQLLTKRPERMRAFVTADDRKVRIDDAGGRMQERDLYDDGFVCLAQPPWLRQEPWPLPNVWLGTSVEDQATADERIPHLLQTPAAIRFISAEPLLGSVDLTRVSAGPLCPQNPTHRVDCLRGGTWELRSGLTRLSPEFINHSDMETIDWVIVGGESGAGSRPCDSWWIQSVVEQCVDFGTPVFVKQLGSHVLSPNDTGFEGDTPGSWPMDTTYETTTPQNWQGDDVRVRLKDRKGSDPAEWPSSLRVRQFPEARA